MSDDISNLIVKVSSESVEDGTKRLDVFLHKAEDAEHATEELTSATDLLKDAFKEIIGPLLTIETIYKTFDKLLDVTKETETLEASLTTLTGSSKTAAEALEQLKEIAAATPFSVQDTTAAFIKLAQNGLDPSRKALESYANFATATNNSILGLAEAVTEAANGQTRALNQLGIKAIAEADGLTLVFKGTATKIKGDAASIQEYIQKIGNTDFAGATAERAKTLEGKLSDLSTAWDNLFETISKDGAGELIKEGVETATDAIVVITELLKSGELKGYVKALGTDFEDWYTTATNAIKGVHDYLEEAFKSNEGTANSLGKKLRDAFVYLPANVEAVVQEIAALFATGVTAVEAVAVGIYNAFKIEFDLIVAQAKSTGQLVADAFAHPTQIVDLVKKAAADQTKLAQDASQAQIDNVKGVADAVLNVGEAYLDTNKDILDNRDKTIAAVDAQIAAAKKLGEAYKLARKEAGDGKDPLSGLGKPRGNDNADEASRQAFEQLKKQLQLQEVTIEESYTKQRAIILKNTQDGSREQIELLRQLGQNTQIELDKANDAHEANVVALQQKIYDAETAGQLSQLTTLRESLAKEEQALKDSYANRKAQILADTTKTESQKAALIAQLDSKANQQAIERDQALRKQQLDQSADFFHNLGAIAAVFGSKGVKIAKDAAIVSATIKTYEAATSAYASLAGIPYIGPALGIAAAGAAIAAGLANVAAIKSQNYSGSYATGGMIPAGSFGIAGEAGAEIIQGPAIVQSARSTADHFGSGRAAATNVFVNVNNTSDATVSVEQRDTSQGKVIDLIVKRAKAEFAKDVRTGSTPIAKALESTYQLNRGKA